MSKLFIALCLGVCLGAGGLLLVANYISTPMLFCAQLRVVDARGYEHKSQASWFRRTFMKPRNVLPREERKAIDLLLQTQCRR